MDQAKAESTTPAPLPLIIGEKKNASVFIIFKTDELIRCDIPFAQNNLSSLLKQKTNELPQNIAKGIEVIIDLQLSKFTLLASGLKECVDQSIKSFCTHVIDLTNTDIDVTLLKQLLSQQYKGTPKKSLSVEGCKKIYAVLKEAWLFKYLSDDLTIDVAVANYIGAIEAEKTDDIDFYGGLVTLRARLMTDEMIERVIDSADTRTLQSDLWSITEDKLFECIKKIYGNCQNGVYDCLQMSNMSTMALLDIAPLVPAAYSVIKERLAEKTQDHLISKTRYAFISSDYLMIGRINIHYDGYKCVGDVMDIANLRRIYTEYIDHHNYLRPFDDSKTVSNGNTVGLGHRTCLQSAGCTVCFTYTTEATLLVPQLSLEYKKDLSSYISDSHFFCLYVKSD